MNKKGFTLVELIAVIAILGILAIIVTPGIFAIRKNVLEKSLNTKITSIHNAALDYATDRIQKIESNVTPWPPTDATKKYDMSVHDCFPVTVANLISEGYLAVNTSHTTEASDANNQLLNPMTNESMNGLTVCVRFNNNNALNRKLIAYIVDECDLYEDDSTAAECLECPSKKVTRNLTTKHWTCKP